MTEGEREREDDRSAERKAYEERTPQQTLDRIRLRCIDLRPWDGTPEVWVCLVCGGRGEYPGFKHPEHCPVRDLYVPAARKPVGKTGRGKARR